MIVVIKLGVYIQDVYGPFDTIDQAKDRCIAFCKDKDEDGYHEYCAAIVKDNGISNYLFRYARKSELKYRSSRNSYREKQGTILVDA